MFTTVLTQSSNPTPAPGLACLETKRRKTAATATAWKTVDTATSGTACGVTWGVNEAIVEDISGSRAPNSIFIHFCRWLNVLRKERKKDRPSSCSVHASKSEVGMGVWILESLLSGQ